MNVTKNERAKLEAMLKNYVAAHGSASVHFAEVTNCGSTCFNSCNHHACKSGCAGGCEIGCGGSCRGGLK